MADPTRSEPAPAGDPEVFERGPILPRGAIGMVVLLALVPPLAGALAPDLGLAEVLYGWAVVAGAAVLGAVVTLPQTHRSVRVDARGLQAKGRLEVPVRRIGQVRVLGGGAAATWSWPGSRPRGGGRPRLPSRQNLYGGLSGGGRRSPSRSWTATTRRSGCCPAVIRRAWPRASSGHATVRDVGAVDLLG